MICVIAHDEKKFTNAVRREIVASVLRIVTRVDHRHADGAVIRVQPRHAIARGSGVGIVCDDSVGPFLSNQTRRGLGKERAGPAQIAIRKVQEREPWHPEDCGGSALFGPLSPRVKITE